MHEEYLIKIWIFKYFHISQCLHLHLHCHQSDRSEQAKLCLYFKSVYVLLLLYIKIEK